MVGRCPERGRAIAGLSQARVSLLQSWDSHIYSSRHPKPSACSTNRVAQQLNRCDLRTEACETRSVQHLYYRPGRPAVRRRQALLESIDPRFHRLPPRDECHRFTSHHNAAKSLDMHAKSSFALGTCFKVSNIFIWIIKNYACISLHVYVCICIHTHVI